MVGREEVLAARCQSRVVGVASRNHTTNSPVVQNPSRHHILVCVYVRTANYGRHWPSTNHGQDKSPGVSVVPAAEVSSLQANRMFSRSLLHPSCLAIANHGCAQRSGERRRRLFLSLFGASGSRLRPERVISLKVHDLLPHRRRRQLNRNGYHHDQAMIVRLHTTYRHRQNKQPPHTTPLQDFRCAKHQPTSSSTCMTRTC